MKKMQGAMTALITPFKNGKLDKETFEKLIKRQVQLGIDAVVPVGTTGESATLTANEHKECIEIAVSAVKGSGAKVIAGAGSNATHESIDYAKFAQKAGADGILCVSPYYNKPTQNGLYEHYKAIASSVDIDVVLYNVPGRTSVDINVATIIKLFDDVSNINAVKEATGNIDRVVDLVSKRPDLAVLSGEDAINYPIMASGGVGCISVTANLLPKEIADLTHLSLDGKHAQARILNEKLYALNHAMFIETNPTPIKTAMYIAGLIPSLEFRLPLLKPSSENYKKIEQTIKDFI
ncbi:MAG: 4-hydroxy-tetrahydrodipicolinate synthase [Helicobacteraceae bacterium]